MVFGEESTVSLSATAADDGRTLGLDGVAVRGARAMLGMSQATLCEAAGCGRSLLNDFENGVRIPGAKKVADIKEALETAGAEFLQDPARGIAVRVDRSRAAGRTPRARTMGDGSNSQAA